MQNWKSYTVSEAQKKLESYCAYQERCHKEVKEKLVSMNIIPMAIDQIITNLIKENYLNEARFAQAFVRGKFRIKKWGKLRITRELKQRNISKYNIEIGLKEINETSYIETLEHLIEKRINQVNEANTYKKKQKIADYLLYRGWESCLIYDKLNQLL